MNSKTISKSHLFSYRFLIGLIVLLALENPEIATSQVPPGQSQLPDPSSTTKAAPPTPSSATEVESDIFQILNEEKESISRGLGQEQPISDAPANVYVITDEDIRHSGATDIPTILRRIPGMEVMQMSGADYNVSVRGDNQAAANKLLVLVDGRSIYEYAFGSVFWTLLPVTLPEIKKIEVWKGPASTIYGFNAFDGVINIITKSPAEMKGNTKGAFAQIGAGELGTVRLTAIQAGMHGNFGYRLSYGHDQNQKWENRNALALRSDKVNVLTEYQFKDQAKLMLSGGLVHSNRFDGQVFDITRESSEITNGYINLAYERPNFFVRTSWTRWDQNRLQLLNPDVLNGFGAVTDRTGDNTQKFVHDVYTFWAQHAIHLWSSNQFSYGVNYFHNAVSDVNVFTTSSAQENRFGTYIQDEWRVTDFLTMVAGLRWDLHSELNPTYSPRLSLIYKLNKDHTFRLSASIAYRPPSILESRYDVRNVVIPLNASLAQIGSSNLQPEKITSYEAGYQGWYLNHRLRIRADLFFNHISDFISSGSPAGPATVTFSNFGQADLYGGEVGAELLMTPWLTGFFNYATVQLHQTSDLVAAQGFTTRGAPPYKINAGLRGEWDNGINGEVLVHHVAAANYPISSGYPFFESFCGCITTPATRVPSYTLLNMRGAYRFWHERAEVAITVFNALNDTHRENPVGEIIGSRVMGWLTLRY
jgi:iron complex outermembrane recepter protein